MRTLCALAVVTTAAGVITGLPFSTALACDNDRFPCPIVSDAPETTEAPAKAAPGAPSRKKATNQAAPRQDERATLQDEKARPKSEREAARAPSRAKAAKPEKQEQAVDSAAVAPAAVTPAPAEVQRTENPAPAMTAWPVAPATSSAGVPVAAAGEAPTAPALANGVATVDPNEVNELDLAAAPTPGAGRVVLDQVSAGDFGRGAGGCIHGTVSVRLIPCGRARPRLARARLRIFRSGGLG